MTDMGNASKSEQTDQRPEYEYLSEDERAVCEQGPPLSLYVGMGYEGSEGIRGVSLRSSVLGETCTEAVRNIGHFGQGHNYDELSEELKQQLEPHYATVLAQTGYTYEQLVDKAGDLTVTFKGRHDAPFVLELLPEKVATQSEDQSVGYLERVRNMLEANRDGPKGDLKPLQTS